MKKIDIKGKPYVMVNERVKEFRENEKYKGWSLISELIQLNEDSCVIKASAIDDKGIVRATGFAQEDKLSSIINKTSFVENCETSAWGRALGNLGIGIDDSISSAEETSIAIEKQNIINEQEPPKKLQGKDYKFISGKHAGKTIGEIMETDMEYLNLLLASKAVPDTIKENILEATK